SKARANSSSALAAAAISKPWPVVTRLPISHRRSKVKNQRMRASTSRASHHQTIRLPDTSLHPAGHETSFRSGSKGGGISPAAHLSTPRPFLEVEPCPHRLPDVLVQRRFDDVVPGAFGQLHADPGGSRPRRHHDDAAQGDRKSTRLNS